MPNYTVVEGKHLVTSEPAWFITFADGPHVGLRQSLVGYKSADSAKRRIRDLKRNEQTSLPVPGPVGVAPSIIATIITKPSSHFIPPLMNERLTKERTGVYPARSKRTYRR